MVTTKIKNKDFLFVIIQFLLLTIFFIPIFSFSFQAMQFLKYPGAVISFFGFLIILVAILQLNKNLTPFPTPKTSGTLIKTGLYKYMRHPIYTGIFLAALGLGLFNTNVQQLSIAVILLILFYFKSGYEEKMLLEKYEEYKKYKENTYRFFPFFH